MTTYSASLAAFLSRGWRRGHEGPEMTCMDLIAFTCSWYWSDRLNAVLLFCISCLDSVWHASSPVIWHGSATAGSRSFPRFDLLPSGNTLSTAISLQYQYSIVHLEAVCDWVRWNQNQSKLLAVSHSRQKGRENTRCRVTGFFFEQIRKWREICQPITKRSRV